MSFERFLGGLDARLVDQKYDAIYRGRSREKDRSDEAFAAMLLAVRDEALGRDSGRSEHFDVHRFSDCRREGAECEIHYTMRVPAAVFLQRRLLVRDMLDSCDGTSKQKSLMRSLLSGFEEEPDDE